MCGVIFVKSMCKCANQWCFSFPNLRQCGVFLQRIFFLKEHTLLQQILFLIFTSFFLHSHQLQARELGFGSILPCTGHDHSELKRSNSMMIFLSFVLDMISSNQMLLHRKIRGAQSFGRTKCWCHGLCAAECKHPWKKLLHDTSSCVTKKFTQTMNLAMFEQNSLICFHANDDHHAKPFLSCGHCSDLVEPSKQMGAVVVLSVVRLSYKTQMMWLQEVLFIKMAQKLAGSNRRRERNKLRLQMNEHGSWSWKDFVLKSNKKCHASSLAVSLESLLFTCQWFMDWFLCLFSSSTSSLTLWVVLSNFCIRHVDKTSTMAALLCPFLTRLSCKIQSKWSVVFQLVFVHFCCSEKVLLEKTRLNWLFSSREDSAFTPCGIGIQNRRTTSVGDSVSF